MQAHSSRQAGRENIHLARSTAGGQGQGQGQQGGGGGGGATESKQGVRWGRSSRGTSER